MTIPSRFRHPFADPDPALDKHYQRLFPRSVGHAQPSQIEALAEGLNRGDPLADAWVPEANRDVLERALQGDLEHAPASLRALFEQVQRVPLWVDADKLLFGARTARRAGLFGHFVLADFALLGGYRSAAIAKTLATTGKLSVATAKRLIHTGAYVTLVHEAGSILPGREGWKATIRVRLVHAHVRAALLQSADWDRDYWGVPINQSDSLGTNLLFSTGLLEGCKLWGLRFTRDEEEAVIHLWRYVGYLMGIDEQLLPIDPEGGRRALYMVGVSQPGPDENSRKLAKALYELPMTFVKTRAQERRMRVQMSLRLAMTRRMLGDEGVDQLGLPDSSLRRWIPPIVRLVNGVERVRERVPGGTEAAFRVGDWLLRSGQQVAERSLQPDERRAQTL